MDSSNDLGSKPINLPCLVDSKGMTWLSIMDIATFKDLDIPKPVIAYNIGVGAQVEGGTVWAFG
jgi:hypothetical protein